MTQPMTPPCDSRTARCGDDQPDETGGAGLKPDETYQFGPYAEPIELTELIETVRRISTFSFSTPTRASKASPSSSTPL